MADAHHRQAAQADGSCILVPAIVWCCGGGLLLTTQVEPFHNGSLRPQV